MAGGGSHWPTLCDTVIAPAYRAAHALGVEEFLTTQRDPC